MNKVILRKINPEDSEQRLDRWFKKNYPGLTHGRLEKLLRTGQIRVNGKRAEASLRLMGGEELRIPPLSEEMRTGGNVTPLKKKDATPHQIADLKERILYKDADILAIDKPSGLAVQGGSGISLALDDMLDELRFEMKTRPLLVHRLDRDTSGVLLLARHAKAARYLTAMFREKETRKIYWALVVGTPHPLKGRIDMNLQKGGAKGRERVSHHEEGKSAITYYHTLEHAGKKAAFLALMPVTGRTHQLRAHCATIGHPIIGDGKYGGARSHLGRGEITNRLHLHARSIRIPKISGKGNLNIEAPLPSALLKSWAFFGFNANLKDDPFEGLEVE